jgi:hypothetical protein
MSAFSPSNSASNSSANSTYGLQGTFSGAYNNSSSPVLTLNFGSGSVSGSTSANPSTSQPTSYTPLASVNGSGSGFSQYYIYLIIAGILILGVLIYKKYSKRG